ncbi:MAG: tRNA (adenosine(37)-N6)-threonylcarbamoyltransferase complex dimerization subunit type 1 TsaB [Desulfomonile tiedjei]|uniref:tRNA (Adenosine(37)-N6)-threonylcarbamoyltransferase complex dimerization subunit type 1 TsaB n=1 Tax=Desulfomonile tiedjei TaxID=2358 RepID=A0A9D6V7B7_9BACT|nr:tRNA (adenosine(37)-N6)-threonylcarbamoyltransferase complex dimerization subunit type 1 TsaB [Desulfomonile tiedjei]
MVLLAVHTTSPSLGVAIVERDSVLGEVILPHGKEHLENLAPTIRDLTLNLGITLRDLDALAVATGPGSFSGIRIGIACVKGIAIALGKPVLGVTSLEIQAWNIVEEGRTGISVIDARRGEIYLAVYKNLGGLTEIVAPRLLHADGLGSFTAGFPEGTVLVGDASLERVLTSIPNVQRVIAASPSAAACGLIAYERFTMGAASQLDSLAPLYVRRSDAEEKRGLLNRN